MAILILELPGKIDHITTNEIAGIDAKKFICKIKVRICFKITKGNYTHRLRNSAAALEVQEKVMQLLNEYFEPTQITLNT